MSGAIHIAIERIVLAGVALDSAGIGRLRGAMVRELVRLLRTQPPGALQASGAVPRLPPLSIGALRPGERPERIGVRLARAVHRSLEA